MIALFSIFVAAAFAAECCLPEKHEALAMGYDRPLNMSFFETISYDYPANALRVDRFSDYRSVNQRHQFTLFLLRDFKDNQLKEYKYFRENNTCVKRVETRPFHKSCVKSNHHRKFDFTIGLGYQAVLYEYVTKTHVEAAAVSKHECAPINGKFFEHHHSGRLGFELEIRFWDVKLGISNPIVFELPAACDKA